MNIEDIKADIAAFADNEDAIEFDKGYLLFERDREQIGCQLLETPAGVVVEIDGTKMSYQKFLGEYLGRMSVLAQALIQKRRDINPYIDTQATTTDSLGDVSNSTSALEALADESKTKLLGETKLIFLTADAGHGKTALLRRLTRRTAEDYLAGKSDRILFHIDTQGRSFVRLEEAVARDLGQLRIYGLFYPGVIRLVRHGLLSLAIDGFDELLAEIGVSEAYSGLGALLRHLQGNGVVIASARSAYFEIENYAAQTKLLSASPDTHVSVSQTRLERWAAAQTINFFSEYRSELGERIQDPAGLYKILESNLGSDHPVLHRPFLVSRLAALIAPNQSDIDSLTTDITNSGLEFVPAVIRALLKREVEEKWRDQSGNPYLSVDQHLLLLSAIADEMWIQGKNSLSIDMVNLVTEAVVDDLGIPTSAKVQVVQRIRAHALLPVSSGQELSFDHEEFLNFFLAVRLVNLLRNEDKFGFLQFSESHPIPEAVATWCAHLGNWSKDSAKKVVSWLSDIAKNDSRSSYLKQNIGSVAAQVAKYVNASGFPFHNMYFEGKVWAASHISDSDFVRCTFINVDFSLSSWINCRLEDCNIDGVIIDDETSLEGTSIDVNTNAVGVLRRRIDEEDSGMKSYVPDECKAILANLGAKFAVPEIQVTSLPEIKRDIRKALDIFFRIFTRNTGANESVTKMKLGPRYTIFERNIIPLMLKNGLIEEAKYYGSGQQKRWELCFPMETILRAEDPGSSTPAHIREFWSKVREL